MSDPIKIHHFDNGLVLIGEAMDWLESAAFAMMLPVGSETDPDGLSGLSSFTCEMALRGAGPYDSRAFVERLDDLGAERSESVGKSHTVFGAATLSEHLIPVMETFAEVARRPHLPGDQLEAGRLVMYQELRAMEDEPSQKVMMELRRGHYPHVWGRPTIGDWDSVSAITIADIHSHFEKTYRPNGTVIGVAGRFDWNQLVDEVGRLFNAWSKREEPIVDPGQRGPVTLHIPDETAQTHIGISYPSVPYKHDDYFLAWSGMGILSGGTSSRLFTEVREKRGLCYSVYASYHTLLDLAGVFCYAGTSAERAQETLDVTVQELQRLKDGINEDELERLKARIKSALIMQQESSGSRAGSIARDWYHLGRVRSMEEIDRMVNELTRERINDYFAANPPSDFTFVTLGPEQLEAPRGVS